MLRVLLDALQSVKYAHRKRDRKRRLLVETLESRALFAGMPFGATPDDTAEFMLGRIAVTPVFLESNGQIDPNTENWTTSSKKSVMDSIENGLNWWKQLLATKSSVMTLDFVVDKTYVDTPFPTPYEPISRVSNSYVDWVSQFLVSTGFSQSNQLDSNIRAFNHSQRQKVNANWSFTIFVVNSQNDADGNFASGGSFDRAFSFAGGLFEVVPSTRPASIFAHETGHMFWARDEYIGGSNYLQKRGYYNAQNTNAIDLNPTPGFVQEDSIMSSNSALDRAFQNITTSAATLAQIGWVDSDNDGIFDVLDVPLKLEGVGQLSADGTQFNFTGRATVQTLPNINSAGLQNDITLNRVGRIEYRFNGGAWQTIASPNQYQADLDLNIPIPTGTVGSIEIRAIDPTLAITSNVFTSTLELKRTTAAVPGIQGMVWNDQNRDGKWQANELAISGAQIRVLDNSGQPISLQKKIEPDNYASGTITPNQNGITIEAIGDDSNGTIGVFEDTNATTGTKVFRPFSNAQFAYATSFRGNQLQLRASFAQSQSSVSIDVVAVNDNTVARLDAYNSAGKIIGRYQSPLLSSGGKTTMQVTSNASDIAYVIARGVGDARIKLDNLVAGPATVTTSQANGSYLLEGIPSGTYQVEIIPPTDAYQKLQPSNGLLSTVFVAGLPTSHLDFALTLSTWQNPANQYDVNNDGLITPLDVLIVINEINLNGARLLDGASLVPPPFYDVDGNRNLEALDVLIVINYINAHPDGEGEAAPLEASPLDFDSTDDEMQKRKSLFKTRSL